jgi:tripartite-type tricarboxylate transporter receptor subunit TctC
MKTTLALTLGIAAAAIAVPAAAQQYPAKSIRVVVPYVAGGNTDFTARVIAQKLAEAWGQQIIIENRPGGATNIGSDLVAKAVPDGYTILMGGAANAINMSLYPKMPYDTQRDFAPIILCVQGANLLAIHPSLPAKNVKELIALAKARPGKMSYGSSGLGSSNQMAGELFKLMAGVDILHVPYKGNPPAITDTIGGQIEMVFSGVPALIPHIQAGRLRAIGIGSAKRFPAVPDVPTISESGLKGYEATTWFGLMAPVKVPREIITKWNAEVGRILASQEVSSRFISEGIEPMGNSPEWFAKFIADEIAKYAKVVKAANLKGE